MFSRTDDMRRNASSFLSFQPSRRDQAEAIEREVMGDIPSNILAEDSAVTDLIKQHSVLRSRIKGSGKNGRITKRDVEAYVEKGRLSELRSKLKTNLNKHGQKFVTDCEAEAKKIMASDSNWQNSLANALEPALRKYAKGVQKDAQAEVNKLRIALTVPTFPAPKLGVEIEAGKATSITGDRGTAGAWTGGATGAVIGTLIFPGIGTVIGGLLGAGAGSAAGEEITTHEVTLDEMKSLTNVQTAARTLLPALKKETLRYFDRVEKAVAARLGVQTVGQDDIVQQLDRHIGV
jgi:hypothetical protein